jgi:MFS family permease
MRRLTPDARRYLWYMALLTAGLSLYSLFFNLLLLALGYDQRLLPLPFLGELSLLGLLNSAPILTSALSSLPLWLLVSRWGPRPALIAGTLLTAITLLGTALWPEPLSMLAWIALSGPAGVLYQVGSAPFMLRHSSPKDRDLLFSLSAGLTIIVGGVSSLVGGQLPALLGPLLNVAPQSAELYRVMFGIAALFTLVALLPLLRAEAPSLAVDPPATAAASSTPNLTALYSAVRIALPFMISPLFISCGASLFIPFLNLYFRQQFAASDGALGLIFALIGFATGAATLATPLLAQRLGKMGSVVLSQVLGIPCLLLLVIAPNLWSAALIAVARGALMNMATPLYDAFTMERTPEAARPIVIGLIGAAFSVGYIVGPTVSVEIQRTYGFGPIFLVTAAFYACAALANYLIFVHPERRGRLSSLV